MAENRQKAPKDKVPVTRHPLFPAIAALWFGALFGLGSLAIRPGLIEGLVLKFGIDTLVPAAAPPLGVTARILIALALAVVGGVLGATIARKLAEPKIKDHQRKRGAAGPAKVDAPRARDSHPDAPARRPVSVHEEIGSGMANPAGATAPYNSGRRGALVFDAGEEEFNVPNTAPLPGGDLPQIFELEALHAIKQPEVGVTMPAAIDDLPPLDLKPFNQFDVATAVPAEPIAPMEQFAPPAPFAPVAQFAPAAQLAPTPLDLTQPEAAAADVAQRQVFGQAPQQDAAAPAFALPQAVAIDFAQPVVASAPPLAEPHFAAAEPAAEFSAPQPAPAFAAPVAAPATPPIADAPRDDLDALDLVGLTQRFANSLKQRRELAAASPAPQTAPFAEDAAPLTLPSFNAAEPLRQPDPIPEVAAVQAAISPPTQQFGQQFTAPPQFGEAINFAADPTVAQEEALPTLVLPSALRPINLDHFDDDEDDHSNLLPLRRIAMPPQAAAPVPVSFEPEPALAEPVAAVAQFAASEEAAALEEGEAEIEAEAEGGYSSLLDLNRDPAPRPQFVRIEEPAAHGAAIEPVVIFPGQAMGQALGQAAPPFGQPAEVTPMPFAVPAAAPAAAAAPEALRQFDAPGAAMAGQAINPQLPGTTQDPEETERALRAALASLQRMSGAA